MQNIFESIFDMLLWQRQNHFVNHEIARDLYIYLWKPIICATFLLSKIIFYALNAFEKFLNALFGSKATRNIFTICMYDQNGNL